jgi:O-acetylserine/cysteine efflux transporter
VTTDRRRAFVALTVAGVLWGTTVPLSKVALDFLDPAWLALVRFLLAGICLIAVVSGTQMRAALRPSILIWGAFGYGGSILVQNVGVAHTSVTHAALLVGMTPILVAAGAAAWSRSALGTYVWAGAAVSVVGVGLVASGHGSGSTLLGDALVLVSLVFACSFTVAQGYLLPGRDPVAVTAAQFVAASLVLLPIALVSEGVPSVVVDLHGISSTVGLALLGTLAPFVLFAYAQGIVPSPIAGAFINIEPLVGVAIAAILMGEALGFAQALGAAAIVAGLVLTSRDQVRQPVLAVASGDERLFLADC